MNLLYPYGKENVKAISEDTWHDLAMDELVGMMTGNDKYALMLKRVLTNIPLDEKTALYRQDILKDFINDERFCLELEGILKELDVLKEFNDHNRYLKEKKSSIRDLVDYLSEMKVYLHVIEGMIRLFSEHQVNSEGLKETAILLKDVVDSEKLSELQKIVDDFSVDLSAVKSMHIGVNFSPDLYPEEFVVLGFNNNSYNSKFKNTNRNGSILNNGLQAGYREPDQFMKYICSDIEKELGKMVKINKKKLRKYVDLKGYFLLDICDDIRYYLLAARFARSIMAKGNPICFPIINNDNAVDIKDVYNLRLTNKAVENIVKNDFSFSSKEKVYILTGPNRGGKTMLTQGVGIAALFASQGLFVPASSYEGFLFENILTHFPADENLSLDLGRLGEEAVRIQSIVKNASEKTLVLLNETYSSTSAYDGLYLAKDLMHALKHKNVPTLFNTHIHELAHCINEMNEWEGASDIVSLTMEIKDNVNTFRVLRGEPCSSSFAHNIAFKYGVTYEQMMEA